MTFGVKEVMVIAALAFGIVVTGCSGTPDTSLAVNPQLRIYNAGRETDCKFCFSRYELEFYYPKKLPHSAPTIAQAEEQEVNVPVELEEKYAETDNCSSFVSTWMPSLPSFLK
jgi:hypothetical protein